MRSANLDETKKGQEHELYEQIAMRQEDERKPGRLISRQAVLSAAAQLLEPLPTRMYR